MGDSTRLISVVRIDIPLKTMFAYFYVESEQRAWDSWWGKLFEYLLSLAPARLDWCYDSLQEVSVADVNLTNDQRAGVVCFIRTAPPSEIKEHRTLRRAVEMTPEQERKVRMKYFSRHRSN